MNKKTSKILKIILPLLLGFIFIWYSLQSATPQERRELLDNIVNANPFWLILSLVFGTLSHMSRAYRWQYMLEPMGYKPRFANSFMAVMAGYLANFGIPRSGEVLRAATLSSYEKVPFEKAFGTIISERIADIVIMLAIMGFTLILQTEHLLTYFKANQINPLVTIAILFVLLLAGIGFIWLIKRSNLPFLIKIRKMAQGLIEGMRSIFRMKQKWAFLFHTLFIWLMYILMFYVISFSVPEMVPPELGMMLAAFVVGSLAISATNGGIGVYPVAIGAILVLFGISKQSGEAFGWLTWGTQTLLVLVLGALSFIILPLFNRKNN
ncbi:lysylphosphatidylglycerol synthase transmembrane domain-containing protein [Salegentibacter sediminis]|uniref:lysylphosphatidylglycerol synthase transmembrane domain-containing protein n=1 Tax=Salegentibacter sediminis TaxID=1930251 RepID=UPI0009C0906D|nr:lysylphosphatidylglycerol synthase transmembrane domain-containing protein [Salegentibacter sediminis]